MVRKSKAANNYRFTVVIEKDQDGYFAYCPELQGCYTQGETFESAMENVRDAIKLHIEDRLAEKEPIFAEYRNSPPLGFPPSRE